MESEEKSGRIKRRDRPSQGKKNGQSGTESSGADGDKTPGSSGKGGKKKKQKKRDSSPDEDIIDGFAILSFKSIEDLERCVIKMAKKEEPEPIAPPPELPPLPLDITHVPPDITLFPPDIPQLISEIKPNIPATLIAHIKNKQINRKHNKKTAIIANDILAKPANPAPIANGPNLTVPKDRMSDDISTHSGSGQGYWSDSEGSEDPLLSAQKSKSNVNSVIPNHRDVSMTTDSTITPIVTVPCLANSLLTTAKPSISTANLSPPHLVLATPTTSVATTTTSSCTLPTTTTSVSKPQSPISTTPSLTTTPHPYPVTSTYLPNTSTYLPNTSTYLVNNTPCTTYMINSNTPCTTYNINTPCTTYMVNSSNTPCTTYMVNSNSNTNTPCSTYLTNTPCNTYLPNTTYPPCTYPTNTYPVSSTPRQSSGTSHSPRPIVTPDVSPVPTKHPTPGPPKLSQPSNKSPRHRHNHDAKSHHESKSHDAKSHDGKSHHHHHRHNSLVTPNSKPKDTPPARIKTPSFPSSTNMTKPAQVSAYPNPLHPHSPSPSLYNLPGHPSQAAPFPHPMFANAIPPGAPQAIGPSGVPPGVPSGVPSVVPPTTIADALPYNSSQEFLRHELNNRFLSTQEPSSAAGPATSIGEGTSPFIKAEMHQHLHHHNHTHNHNHTYTPQTLSQATPTLDKKFDSNTFLRQNKNGCIPGPASILSIPDHKSLPPPHLPLPSTSTTPGAVPHKKSGRWCSMHVTIAWHIYRQQNKPDSALKPEIKPSSEALYQSSLNLPRHHLTPSMLSHSGTIKNPYDPGTRAPPNFLNPASMGISPYTRPSPYNMIGPTPLPLNATPANALYASENPSLTTLPSPHDWNHVKRTPPTFPGAPGWAKTEADRETENRSRERASVDRASVERERSRQGHKTGASPHYFNDLRDKSEHRSRSRSPLSGAHSSTSANDARRRPDSKPNTGSSGSSNHDDAYHKLTPKSSITPPTANNLALRGLNQHMMTNMLDRSRLGIPPYGMPQPGLDRTAAPFWLPVENGIDLRRMEMERDLMSRLNPLSGLPPNPLLAQNPLLTAQNPLLAAQNPLLTGHNPLMSSHNQLISSHNQLLTSQASLLSAQSSLLPPNPLSNQMLDPQRYKEQQELLYMRERAAAARLEPRHDPYLDRYRMMDATRAYDHDKMAAMAAGLRPDLLNSHYPHSLPNHLSAHAPLPNHLSAHTSLPNHLSAHSTLPNHLSAHSAIPNHLSAHSTLPNHLSAHSTKSPFNLLPPPLIPSSSTLHRGTPPGRTKSNSTLDLSMPSSRDKSKLIPSSVNNR